MGKMEVSNVKRAPKISRSRLVAVSYDLDMSNPNRTDGPHCPIHPETALVCPSCIAAKTAGKPSARKLRALRRNVKLATIAAAKKRRAANAKDYVSYECTNKVCKMFGVRVQRNAQISYPKCGVCRHSLSFS